YCSCLEPAMLAIIASTSARVIALPVAAVPAAVGVPAAAGGPPGVGVGAPPGASGFAVDVGADPCLKIADMMLPHTLIVSSLVMDQAASLRALDISASVAFSASLTGTPPMPRKPPSLAASATCWPMLSSQVLKAAASPGALALRSAPTWPRPAITLLFTSAGLP